MIDWEPDAERVVILATSTVTLLTSIAAFVQGIRNQHKIQEVHLSVNSRLDQLVATTRQEAHAAGKLEGQQTIGITLPQEIVLEGKLSAKDMP
jgi:hypothetical protein